MSYSDITSDGGMDPRNDPQSDSARLARHRDLHRTVHPDVAATAQRAAEHLSRLALVNSQHQLQIAIGHLQALLNTQRTATQAWEAEKQARDWLESIGSEPT